MEDELKKKQNMIIAGESEKLISYKHAVGNPRGENIIDPEWVIKYRSKRKGVFLRWVAAFIQMFTGIIIAGIFFMIPVDPNTNPFIQWKNPVVCFILICYLGKTLLDTFFYDHYEP